MKLSFNHAEGVFSKSGNCLLEVDCIREHETTKYMFENGWLPFKDDKWYQCQSSRLKLSRITSQRRKELSKIDFSFSIDKKDLIDRSRIFGCFKEEWFEYCCKKTYTRNTNQCNRYIRQFDAAIKTNPMNRNQNANQH